MGSITIWAISSSVPNTGKSIFGIDWKNCLTSSGVISISSTRVYDKESELPCKEIDPIHPTDYRGRLIKEYEEKQIDFYSDKLIILRFSGYIILSE